MKIKLLPRMRAVLLCLLAVALLCPGVGATALPPDTEPATDVVLPGGFPFGVKFTTNGVLIVGFCDIDVGGKAQNPAKSAGLKIKDILTHVNGEALEDAAALTRAIDAAGGKPVTLIYRRGDKCNTATLTPLPDPATGGYKTGLYVRDSGAGIGTVTFVLPQNHAFAGLGHGICDVDTGELMPIERGTVVDVTVSGVNRGLPGSPGEIKGYFGTGKTGTLLGNTPCGVFGLYAETPAALTDEKPIAVGKREEVHEGDATICCTLGSNERRTYSARITNIDRSAHGSKCFAVRITDPALLEESGGIVQGMSGSPILQGGKIIGAVTHVLINDPSAGYGIFIDNMLASMPDLLK